VICISLLSRRDYLSVVGHIDEYHAFRSDALSVTRGALLDILSQNRRATVAIAVAGVVVLTSSTSQTLCDFTALEVQCRLGWGDDGRYHDWQGSEPRTKASCEMDLG
jgi:hypothetical protein